ncbi:MAG: hypothetical protein AB2421_16625 [Thermotaleaceae bacterium]
MKNKAIILTSILIILSTTMVFALPEANLFTPDLSFAGDAVSPIFIVINWGLGVYGLWLFLKAAFSLLKIVASLFKGGSLDGSMQQLKNLGVGVLILLVTITGMWYKFIMFVWSKMRSQGLDGFDEAALVINSIKHWIG